MRRGCAVCNVCLGYSGHPVPPWFGPQFGPACGAVQTWAPAGATRAPPKAGKRTALRLNALNLGCNVFHLRYLPAQLPPLKRLLIVSRYSAGVQGHNQEASSARLSAPTAQRSAHLCAWATSIRLYHVASCHLFSRGSACQGLWR